MEMLQIREKEVFETLRKLKGMEFVVIGGYAVNAYTLPRFSADCGIVIMDKMESAKVETALLGLGYHRKTSNAETDSVDFARYEKNITGYFRVSFDILVKDILDRQTNVRIPAGWVFKNSEIHSLKGKTITEDLKVRIINLDALFVMKMISCRPTDMRDLFMMAPMTKDRKWIKAEVESMCDFGERFNRLKSKISSKEFRNGLQGVYGFVDKIAYVRNVKAVVSLAD